MIGTEKSVRERIASWERGRIFFIDDFSDMESQGSVRIALMRLVSESMIVRLARGIYCYPGISNGYAPKIVLPTEEAIAMALAEKERIRIIPYGDQAAYQLDLTGLRISDLKYLTDGAPRKINLAKGRKIYFNHTSEVKIFDYRNRDMQLISAAIRALGPEGIGPEEKRKIRIRLANVPENEYLGDISIPPAWVQEIIREIRER